MSATGLIHEIRWTPATLSEEPLDFSKVVFVVGDKVTEESDTLSAFQTQLTGEGYAPVIVSNPSEINSVLTSETAAIIVHIPHVAHTRDGLYDAAVNSCASLTTIAQLLLSGGLRNKTAVKLFSLVTKNEGISDLSFAPLYGLARVLKMEIPEIFGGLFETESRTLRFPLSAIKHARGFDVVRVCENEELGVPETASLRPFARSGKNDGVSRLRLGAESAYLITGGTRGMGLEIASWMVERGARHVILVARNGLTSSGARDTHIDNLISRIAELNAQGATVHVLAIDLSLPGADSTLRQAIDRLDMPAIRGVVHAAGIAGYHTLEACKPADIANVLAPKVIGALNLDALFPPGTLDFFALMSSVGQLVGFPGQMSYAPANAFLDGLATHRRREGDNSISVQWTSWRGVGLMAQSKSATRMIIKGMWDRGIAHIGKEEALEAWEHVTTLGAAQVAVVRALELDVDEPLRHSMLKDITPRRKRMGYNDYPAHAVAVVSMACRTAAGDAPDDLWKALQSGKSMVREIDATRFPEPAAKGKRLWGNFLSDIERFDHKFFGKSKREAAALDPHQRLLLETTYHALEAAGWLGGDDEEQLKPETHDPETNRHITGCFIGMNAPDYFLNLASHSPSPYTGGGMLRSFVAGRLSYHFGWTGPSHTLDTACSSAMVAIHQACRALQVGECTRAVAGGVNLITNTALFEALRAGGFLSDTGACKTFDAQADGYCRGEAVGVVVLKPLQKALEDGDDIQGVLLATGNNQNINRTTITNPVIESQAALYRDVLSRAGAHPKDVSYVEAHGTGTRAGDPVEVEGIRQVLGGQDRRSVLHIGAVKPNIGHSEGAAGVISLIKVLLMMKHGKIPGQAQFTALNPNIAALEPDRIAIPTSLREWSDDLRLALVNSYGASGSNAAAVVAPPPVQSYIAPIAEPKSVNTWPIFISAASTTSLLGYSAKLEDYISKNQDNITIAQLAFALATKHSRKFQHTLCTTVRSMDDLQSQLRSPERHITASQTPETNSEPIVLLFSGQNGNTTPSAKALYETSLLFRARLHECEEVMHSLGLPSPIPVVLEGIQSNDDGGGNGDVDLVLRHAAMFSLQYACGMSWIDSGVIPRAICGHSFGEWAALTVSGGLTLEAGLKLVTGRASIIKKLWGADTGSMIAIEADLVVTNTTPNQHLQPFLDEHPESRLEIACYNGPNNYVVAGSTKDIGVLASYLQDQKSNSISSGPLRNKLRYKVLSGMHAYHCHMADGIVDECAALSASIPFQNPTFPFESCHQSEGGEQDKGSWAWASPASNIIARNTRGPVHFGDALQRIVGRLGSSCTFLEAGIAGPIIAMAQTALAPAQHTFLPISGRDVTRSLADATVTLWKKRSLVQFWPFNRNQRASFLTVQGHSLDLPSYQFEKHQHWVGYSDPDTNNKALLSKHTENATEDTRLLCPHCNGSFADFPYIVRERAQSHPGSNSTFNFTIDTRSKRYQDLISGHLVVGTPICPAAMYLELAARAVMLLEDEKNTTVQVAKEMVIETLEIKASLGLDADARRSIKLTLTKKPEDTWQFDLSSTTRNKKDDRPISHGTGIISLCKGRRDKDDSNDTWTRMSNLLDTDSDTEALRGAMVYKVFARMVKYSAAYRGVRYLVGKGSEGAGEIAMPTDSGIYPLAAAPNDSIADVPLMDSFMQVAGAFVHSLRGTAEEEEDGDEDQGGMSYICTGIGLVRPLNGLQGSGKYRVYTTIRQEDGKEVILDLFAFDSLSKKTIWSARGVKFARVPRKSLVKALVGANPGFVEDSKEQQNQKQGAAASSKQLTSNRLDEVLHGVQTVLRRSLDVPVAEITRDALLEELGTDSLVSPEILVGIFDQFKVTISTNDFAEVQDVASLCDLISSQMEDSTNEYDSKNTKDDQGVESYSAAEWQKTIIDILSISLDLGPAEIDMISKLEDLGADSLIAPEIIRNLNKALGLELSSIEFAAAVDVNSLCELVRGALGAASSGSSSSSSSTAWSTPDADIAVTPRSGASSPSRKDQELAIKPSNNTNAGSVHAAFQQVRRTFDAHATITEHTGYWDDVYPQQLRMVKTFILETFEKLGCPLKAFEPGEPLPTIQGALPKYQREVARLWQILIEAGVVEKQGDKFIRSPASLDDQSAQTQSTKLIFDFPQYASTHGLPAFLGPHLAECLTGKADPVAFLFGSEEGRRLLDDFYTNAPDLRAAMQLLCDFLSAAIRSFASSSSNGEPFHILEIGAGTGGTTKHLIPLLQATGYPFTYTFTDLSVSLVTRAKNTAFKGVAGMEFLKLNVEEEPPQELQGRYHAVVSSICVHAARDLKKALANTRKLIRPDNGFVALVELTQKLPWYDLVWGLLDGWWLFDDGREYALQAPWAWERAMRDSGFAHIDWSESSSRESRSVGVIVGFAAQEPQQQQQQLVDRTRTWPSKATSMLVHRGVASPSNNQTLFLAPDGRGYGTVFNPLGQHLARTSLSISVYALNSPFTTIKHKIDPSQDVPAVEEMAGSYVAEIKRRQPNGPYMVGGYSFGGIVAFEAARQLLEAGDEVTQLVLIDVACPTFSTCPPDNLLEYLHANLPPGVGLNKTRNSSKKEGDDDATLTSGEDGITISRQQLRQYKPKKLPGWKTPQTILVSARQGLNHGGQRAAGLDLRPEDQRIADWFLNDRTDGGPLGWEELMGDGNVKVVRADCNHFNVVLPLSTMAEWVSELVELLEG
ncbi:hypothetical protein BDV12DRAFT_198031 [Aspergillus spectabilis]